MRASVGLMRWQLLKQVLCNVGGVLFDAARISRAASCAPWRIGVFHSKSAHFIGLHDRERPSPPASSSASQMFATCNL